MTGWHSGFNVFSYLTFRAILATVSALAISLLVGPSMIARLSRYQIGQVVRDDGPKTHLPKAGTPTMGGTLILVTTLVEHAAVGGALRNRFVWMVLGVTFAFGLIGFYDDYLKLVVRNSKGLVRALEVFLAVGGGAGDGGDALLHARPSRAETTLFLPFVKTLRRAAVGVRLHRDRLSA